MTQQLASRALSHICLTSVSVRGLHAISFSMHWSSFIVSSQSEVQERRRRHRRGADRIRGAAKTHGSTGTRGRFEVLKRRQVDERWTCYRRAHHAGPTHPWTGPDAQPRPPGSTYALQGLVHASRPTERAAVATNTRLPLRPSSPALFPRATGRIRSGLAAFA